MSSLCTIDAAITEPRADADLVVEPTGMIANMQATPKAAAATQQSVQNMEKVAHIGFSFSRNLPTGAESMFVLQESECKICWLLSEAS